MNKFALLSLLGLLAAAPSHAANSNDYSVYAANETNATLRYTWIDPDGSQSTTDKKPFTETQHHEPTSGSAELKVYAHYHSNPLKGAKWHKIYDTHLDNKEGGKLLNELQMAGVVTKYGQAVYFKKYHK